MENRLPYRYIFRPVYGGKSMLIEFMSDVNSDAFLTDLLEALAPLNLRIGKVQDIWMNDEIWTELLTDAGTFSMTKDIWENVFILPEKSPDGIEKLDALLAINPKFQKDPVDFEKYRR